MKSRRLLIFISMMVMVASCGCTKKRELPQTDGKFERYTENVTFHSDILGTDALFSIYLPESYVREKDRRYPVVYMLHGLGDNNNSWNGKYLHANSKISALESQGLSEMIYIYPCGYSTYYCNKVSGKYNYMDMFVQELMTFVDKNYRTIADREHRAITGYSMGGFGAMVLAEKHPELFSCSAPLSMSFRTDAQYMTEPKSGWDGQWGSIFGGAGAAGVDRLTDYYKEHCPYYQFTPENRETLSKVHWFFTCGDDEEQLLVANDSLHVLLRDNGYSHEFRVENGAHTSTYWMSALSEVLPYFDYHMNGNSNWPQALTIRKIEPSFRTDGSAVTSAWAEGEETTAFYIAYEGWDEDRYRECISALYSTNTMAKFVYLPCDISVKSLSEWIQQYSSSYHIGASNVVAFGSAGTQAYQLRSSFATNVYIDAELGDSIQPQEGEKYYFATSDDGKNYADMGELYRACKRSGASFEYRVVDSASDEHTDYLRCLTKLQYLLSY